MKYLKIRAKNYNEAMMKLKVEHGDDAIPISHKYVKEGGILNTNFFAKEVVELTAAIQEKKLTSRRMLGKRNIDFTVDDLKNEKPAAGGLKKSTVPNDGVNIDSLNKSIDTLNDNLNDFKSNDKNEQTQEQSENELQSKNIATFDKNEDMNKGTVSISKFEKEFDEIKKTLREIVKGHGNGNDTSRIIIHDDTIMKPYVDMLKNNDYDSEECNEILREVKNSISRDDLDDKYKIEKSLKDLLKSRIITTGPIKTGNKKKIMMFIGPTGVGKTTTMAKLGAIHSLREAHNVVFVTIDNYRIAATEQLKKYAEIMRIPVHAVNNQKEFKDIISNEKAEIIMVDTSGRSHRNELKISEIKSFADLVEYDFEIILCVSANTKKRDLNDIFKSFDTMNFNSIVITKVDETSFVGNVVDIADKYNKPISYFTNGQEVPNDIVVADPDNIVDMMIGNIN